MPIARYHSPTGSHITLTAGSAVPSGFTEEGPLGYLVRSAVPGTVRFYLCQVLGYIYVHAPSGLASAPLYRCNSGGSHYDTLRSDCEGNGQLEGASGYVL